jgi:diaminopimelate epimerase
MHFEDVATLNTLDLQAIGSTVEAHELFPNRTNVSWYTEIPHAKPSHEGEAGEPPGGGGGGIRVRIFERGVGETLSSGTGATGAAIAHRLAGGPSHIRVLLDGGELDVEIGEELRVNLTGWARPVFEGRLSDDFMEELNDTTE